MTGGLASQIAETRVGTGNLASRPVLSVRARAIVLPFRPSRDVRKVVHQERAQRVVPSDAMRLAAKVTRNLARLFSRVGRLNLFQNLGASRGSPNKSSRRPRRMVFSSWPGWFLRNHHAISFSSPANLGRLFSAVKPTELCGSASAKPWLTPWRARWTPFTRRSP